MELISREELLKQIETDSKGNGGQYGDEWLFIDTINSIPAVEERKEGHWGYTDDMYETFVCSVCGFDTEDYEKYNYCPNCGAKMYEDDKDIYVPNKGE